MNDLDCARVRASADFVELERARGQFGRTLAIVMLVIYFGFVLMVAFAPHVMATPVLGTMTLGFPLGLGVIVSAIALTGVYVLRANGTYDALTRRIKEQAL